MTSEVTFLEFFNAIYVCAGADPGFDQGGPQIVTGLKLPFWGLSFVEFWCWGLIFGGQGGAGPPGPPGSAPGVTVQHLETKSQREYRHVYRYARRYLNASNFNTLGVQFLEMNIAMHTHIPNDTISPRILIYTAIISVLSSCIYIC